MKFDVKFKSIDYSEPLANYVEERFEKLAKFEIKQVTVHVTFSEERHSRRADVYVKGMNGSFRAKGDSDSFYVSLDLCLKKLARQMEREKSRIKEHHILPSGKANRRAA